MTKDVAMTGPSSTRDRLLAVAEQLFAEHGVFAVSNRQVSEAAGQGNNAAVGYHFGTKADLLRAIVQRHTGEIEQHRCDLVAQIQGSTEVRDWVACLVQSSTGHYARSRTSSWYARFSAQVLTDPGLRDIVYSETMTSPSLQQTIAGLAACLPDLPEDVRRARSDMMRHLMTHMCAERERAIAEAAAPQNSWDDFAVDMIEALVGLWLAPVTSRR